MSKFYSLKVQGIKSLTSDSVQITFNNEYPDLFNFKAGQYITLRKDINGQDVRRSYSLSSSPNEGLQIGVKRIENGLMSTFLTKDLKVGDVLDVMLPMGNFFLDENNEGKHYVAICAGSGITPILSMIKYIVEQDSESYFTLIYGNRSRNSIMFAQELQDLENNYQSQLFVHYVFSREEVENFLYGRVDENILKDLFQTNKELGNANSYFLCGPGQMIDNVNDFLLNLGVEKDNVFFERFTSNNIEKSEVSDVKDIKDNNDVNSNVLIFVDGDEFEFQLSSKGKSILDAAMDEGADVPFSCKGGVCCVCKAKVIKGEVKMDQNFSLSEDELKDGYILSCQSHPVSEDVEIDFDVI